MTEESERLGRTAYHEGGHAVAAWVVGLETKGASVVPKESSLGRVVYEHVEAIEVFDELLRRHLISSYAGVKAVEILTGQPIDPEDVNMDPSVQGTDWDMVMDLVLRLAGTDEEQQLLVQERAEAEALCVLKDNWRGVEAVATALLERRNLDGADLSRILQDVGCQRGEPLYEHEMELLSKRLFELIGRERELMDAGQSEEAQRVALERTRVQSKMEELGSWAEEQSKNLKQKWD
jgi:hypothetical protein